MSILYYKNMRTDVVRSIFIQLTFQLLYGFFTRRTIGQQRCKLPHNGYEILVTKCSSLSSSQNDCAQPVGFNSDRQKFSLALSKIVKSALIYGTAIASTEANFISKSAARWDDILRIPLQKYDGVFCMNYTVNGNQYRGIVDTGSPFLIVPSVNTRIWGSTSSTSVPYIESGLPKTTEIFGGQDYETYWKVGDLKLANSYALESVVFANVGEDIMRPPGGVFVGLIKYKAEDIRPTLMGQMKFSSIQFDIDNRELLLSKNALIPAKQPTAIKMTDLRVLGDPVYHYAAQVKSLEINGRQIAANSTIYAVFDTGTTGCVLSDDLMNDYETPNPIRKVRIVLRDEDGEDVYVESGASREEIFVVTAAKIPWFTKEPEALKNYYDDTTVELPRRDTVEDNSLRNFSDDTETEDERTISANISRRLLVEPQVVVIGLTFFKNKVLTIDIDEGRLTLTDSVQRPNNS
jgi:hypothetical protein